MEIGERIRQLRIHKKMKQIELVDGISSITYLSRIENNQIKPSMKFLQQIAERLGVEIDYLLNMESSDYRDKIKDIVTEYRITQTINDEDLMFLKLHSLEMHTTEVYLKIYATLIRYFVDRSDLKEAREMYDLSNRFVPEIREKDLHEDFFFYYMSCGHLFYHAQDYIHANKYFTWAESVSDVASELELGKMFYNISITKQKIAEDKTICLYYSQKAYEIFKARNDRNRLIQVLITRGIQYHVVNKFEQSLESLRSALEMVESEPQKYARQIMYIEYNFGRVYQCMSDYPTAIEHLKKAISLNEEHGHAETENFHSYKRLMEIYIELKDWINVDNYLDKATGVAQEYELTFDYIELYALKATIYKLRFDEVKYEKEMQKVIDYCVQNNQLSQIKKLANDLGLHYYEKRAYKKAADYFAMALSYEQKMTALTQG
ncbi:helix-turn-helix transcriptional regulator [Brevibacillus dissolubilis]|uniref:helix-turn-helix transcriptional regulator n=1 Tax=Brevibacillus dissolubilis TaxID=1844116 RepID=UPI0011168274|nr:helix-turn-helix transcriptional regulator [Brevibacillus dissolubilis]